MSKQQQSLILVDPATGEPKPYPSHAAQWRQYYGESTAWLFNPWNGSRRSAGAVGLDVQGILIVPEGEPVYSELNMPKQPQPHEQNVTTSAD